MHTHTYTNPVAYSKSNSLQYHFAMETLSKAKISLDARVLDLGCGDGRITYQLAKIAHHGYVIGTDISETMINHANQIYNSQDNLRFVQMDTSKNTFRSRFNLITSFNSLHWVKDQENALKGIANAGSENAKVILLLSHKKSNYHFTLDTLCKSPQWTFYFTDYPNPRFFFTKENYNELLLNAGLNVISLKEKEMSYEFNSIQKLKEFLAASMANIKKIPDNLKDNFLEDYCVEFLKQSNCRDISHIPVTFWCLEIFAVKSKFTSN